MSVWEKCALKQITGEANLLENETAQQTNAINKDKRPI